MSPVLQSMYMVLQTAAQGSGKPSQAAGAAHDEEKPLKCCRWCGETLINPRRNQTCCNAECRDAWERSKRSRRKQAAAEKPKGICLWCCNSFDKARRQQDFCCPDHQQEFNNFWKGRGPALAKALHAWRVEKKPGAMTDVCREFGRAREDLKHKQTNTKRAKK